jgi:hypothetical protein
VTTHISIGDARTAVRTALDLRESGWREVDIRRHLDEGVLRRIQRNRYVELSVWDRLWPESRHRLEIVAVAEEMRGGSAAVSHQSAIALQGGPLYRHAPAAVHVTVPGPARISSRARLIRHHDRLAEDDVVLVDGIRCTTLERAVFDVARTLSFESAVAAADAALRSVAMRDRVYDQAAAAEWRDRMRERAARSRGARGVRQAVRVIEFTDGRAESPGESDTRVKLARLGFRDLQLQMRVSSPSGGFYEIDLGAASVRCFFEFDGETKYRDEAMRSGRSIEDVMLAEKQREDWIRGVTQWRMCRVMTPHLATIDSFAARLASFHIHAPH